MQGVWGGDLQMLPQVAVAPRTPHAGAIFSSQLDLQARAATQPARSARLPPRYHGRLITTWSDRVVWSISCRDRGLP